MHKSLISIEALEVLDTIERRGSFAKAAEELNKATSALSYTVQKLEEQLDVTLFQRQGRRSVLTQSGQFVLKEGREILAAVQKLTEKAREVESGWETQIRIAIESVFPSKVFFKLLSEFMAEHKTIEVEIQACILNGGWELLENDQVDLVIGVPGPVPPHKGYSALPLDVYDLVPVIAKHHHQAKWADDRNTLEQVLPSIRRVITRDSSLTGIKRSAGLLAAGQSCYTQTLDQKIEAIRSGIGIGHLPRHKIQHLLDSGELIEMNLEKKQSISNYMAWRLNNKGRGLKQLTQMIMPSPAVIKK